MKCLVQDNLEALEDGMFIVAEDTFKRLNEKTQVMTNTGFYDIRTRLTHSLEVAAVGKYLAQQINTNLGFDLVNPSTVENICKVHDLGHGPLGHVGATTINKVFGKVGVQFEDNANSLVILEKYYPRMSEVVTLSTIKYPYPLGEGDKKDKGLYDYQLHYIESLNNYCKKQSINKDKILDRTYESYIMELADDISYLTGDLEDFLRHYDYSLNKDELEIIYINNNFDKDDFFDYFLGLNRENITFEVWQMRKQMIRNIYFDVDNNNFAFHNDKYERLKRILRCITLELYIKKHSIRPGSDITHMFEKYLWLLIQKIDDKRFLRKEINSKRLYQEIKSVDKEDNLNSEERKIKKIKILSYAVSEMTDTHLLKRLKKQFLINF